MPELANPFTQWANLAQPRLGARVAYATDDFFAAKERLIEQRDPIFVPGKFDEHGKWMDGWESRRKRDPGHDFCIIRLGAPSVIRGLDIDTTHFTGNFPPAASVEACVCDDDLPTEDSWHEIQSRMELMGDSHHFVRIEDERSFSHLRLHIYPDGGVARLRVYGEVRPLWDRTDPDTAVDLFALENGGRALVCNDEHFGSMHNLNVPGRGINMGDGWETARRRVPGNDWVVLVLGGPGTVERVEIDTAHFKGNYPDKASLQAAFLSDFRLEDLGEQSASWETLLPPVKLEMDRQHVFSEQINSVGIISHVRLNIFPDGGISRLRLFGRISPQRT